jgi:hypothetical protein
MDLTEAKQETPSANANVSTLHTLPTPILTLPLPVLT